MRSSASISQAFYMNFKDIFWRNPINSVFQMFLDFDWQFLYVRSFILFLLCYKRLLLLKMPFFTLRKLCYYYAEKGKIRQKNPGGKNVHKCIIMYHNASVLPIRNFWQWHKKQTVIPNLQTVFTPFVGLKMDKVFSNLFLIGCR